MTKPSALAVLAFKPGTYVRHVNEAGERYLVLQPLNPEPRRVRLEDEDGTVRYAHPANLVALQEWSAPTIKAEHEGRVMGARIGDGPPILVPMCERPQPPVLDAKSLRLRAILWNLVEVAAAKRGQAVERIAGKLALAARDPLKDYATSTLDPLRNVVAPIED